MSELIMQGAMGIVLLICSIQDVIHKKIYIWIVIIGALVVGGCIPFCHTYSIPERIGGAMIGISVILISKATKGKIGMGDGFLLCVTGLGLGLWSNLEMFAIALFAAAVSSIILLILRLVNRKKSIPFIPFLLLGYLFLIVVSP